MEASRFDRLTKTLTSEGTRRGALRLLATLPVVSGLTALLAGDDAAAVNGRRKRRKKRHQHRKGDRKRNRKGKRTGQHTGKDKGGACSTQSDCGADALCLSDGSCQACTVGCMDTPAACGSALQTALAAGGTVYVCAGVYQGGFTIDAAVTVIGAGDGEDPATNTILDGNGATRVVQIGQGTGTVALQRLLITGGVVEDDAGAGIRHEGTTLRMSDCTIEDNAANDAGGGFNIGGGIYTGNGTLELTRCTVRDNHAASEGGGIYTAGTTTLTDCLIAGNDASIGGGINCRDGLMTLTGSTQVRENSAAGIGGGILLRVGDCTLTIAESCRVTANLADIGNGGGINLLEGTVTLEGADPSPIVVDNCHENCVGDVPKCAPGGSCPA